MISVGNKAVWVSIAVAVLCVAVNKMLPTEFERNFDRNLARNQFAASLAQRDPALRDLLLRQTEAAYDKGGWRAAQATLTLTLASELEVYADDQHVLATARGTLRVLDKLKKSTADCKAFLLAGARIDDFHDARPELDESAAAERAAIQNGFDRKLQGVAWRAPLDDAILADERSLALRPQALSSAELQALATYADGDAAPYCGGSIKLLTNLLSRAASEAVRIKHQEIYLTSRIDWVKVMGTLCRGHEDRSGGLVCAQALAADTQ